MYVIDSHSLAGRPTVLYETNQSRPCPYRSDYPLRVAALACWQDWDGVVFHYWGGLVAHDSAQADTPDECYLLPALPHVNRAHYWTGVQHAFDPVMCSSMAIAGRMFLGHAAAPAPAPLLVDVGRKGIFGFDAYNGLGLGPATFARGAKIRFTPERETGVSVDGRPLPEPEPVVGAVRSGREIVWDWPHARLIVDTPTYKAYVGRTAGAYRFSDGLTLSDVNLPWICFALASDDGRPLVGPNASRRMLLSATFDARNRGFQIDPAFLGGGPLETADAIRNRGTAPVIVDKPGHTLQLPHGDCRPLGRLRLCPAEGSRAAGLGREPTGVPATRPVPERADDEAVIRWQAKHYRTKGLIRNIIQPEHVLFLGLRIRPDDHDGKLVRALPQLEGAQGDHGGEDHAVVEEVDRFARLLAVDGQLQDAVVDGLEEAAGNLIPARFRGVELQPQFVARLLPAVPPQVLAAAVALPVLRPGRAGELEDPHLLAFDRAGHVEGADFRQRPQDKLFRRQSAGRCLPRRAGRSNKPSRPCSPCSLPNARAPCRT